MVNPLREITRESKRVNNNASYLRDFCFIVVRRNYFRRKPFKVFSNFTREKPTAQRDSHFPSSAFPSLGRKERGKQIGLGCGNRGSLNETRRGRIYDGCCSTVVYIYIYIKVQEQLERESVASGEEERTLTSSPIVNRSPPLFPFG